MSEYQIKLTEDETKLLLDSLMTCYVMHRNVAEQIERAEPKEAEELRDKAQAQQALYRLILKQTSLPCPICQGHHTTAGEG